MPARPGLIGPTPNPAPPPAPVLEVVGTTTTITAQPVTVNISLYAGDDYSMVITVRNPDASLVDLTGYTATGQVKNTKADVTALGTFTCATGGTAGTVTASLANTLTASLPTTGSVVYDIQIKSGGNLITTLIAGTITTVAQVTTP
jgi:hypothetical protein